VGLDASATLVAAMASRHDSPELAAVWRPPPSSFDAEDGPGLVARFVAPEVAATAAEQVTTPIAITRRGAVIHAHK
jgi:hypothetical protein